MFCKVKCAVLRIWIENPTSEEIANLVADGWKFEKQAGMLKCYTIGVDRYTVLDKVKEM